MSSSDETVNKAATDGMNIPDIRIGMKATYGKWEGKVDVEHMHVSRSVGKRRLPPV